MASSLSSPTTGKIASLTTPSGCPSEASAKLEQQAGFAADALEILQQLFLDLALSFGADALDQVDQQLHQCIGERLHAPTTENGQQRDTQRRGVTAQLIGLFDRRTLLIGLKHFGGDAGEQPRRQIQCAQPVESLDLPKQRIEGGRAWIGAQCLPGRTSRDRGGFLRGISIVVCFQQGLELLLYRRRQALMDGGAKSLIERMLCRADQAVETRRRRGLDLQASQPLIGGRLDVLEALRLRQAMIAEPTNQRLAIGDGRFPEAEQLADLGTVRFARAITPVVLVSACRRRLQLAGQVIDHRLGYLAGGFRKSPLMLKKLKQHGKPESGRLAFAQCLLFFSRRQGPVLNQLVWMPVAFHDPAVLSMVIGERIPAPELPAHGAARRDK